MLALHPQILEKDGKREFAILPYEEFERLVDELADYQDLKELRAAKGEEGNALGKGLSEVRDELGI